MKRLRFVFSFIRDFFTRYPALLSGVVLYSYLLFTIIRFYLRVQHEGISFAAAFESFDALPFMWFLAVSLVKIIEVRSRLFESERQRLLTEQTVRQRETQLETLRQVIKSLQHHINNPLAIISLAVSSASRAAAGNAVATKQLELIRESANRIDNVLTKLGETSLYEVETPSPVIGSMTKV